MDQPSRRVNQTPSDIQIGQQFGQWTVIARAEVKRYGTLPWVCRCNCGQEGLVERRKLLNGKSTRCKPCSDREKNQKLQVGRLRRALHTVDAVATKRIWTEIRAGARRRHLSMTLTPDDVVSLTTSCCFYCGAPPSNVWKVKRRGVVEEYLYSGVDRIDSSKGYEPGNVVACCSACNRAKSDRMSSEEFLHYLVRAGQHAAGKLARPSTE